MTYTKLDHELIPILRCPLCKSLLDRLTNTFTCTGCSSQYGQVVVSDAANRQSIQDFRIHRPTYCNPTGMTHWAQVQSHYETYHDANVERDNLEMYRQQIESVRDLYTEHFPITGRVLDVGGHQGRLRHFLDDEAVPLYVATDPFPDVFKGLTQQPNLLRAYPCLRQPCNFFAAHAESLPLTNGIFDWVHMRSVLDHFADPYVALKEAYRVLKPGGHCLIGLTVESAMNNDLPDPARPGGAPGIGGHRWATATARRHETLQATLKAAVQRLRRPVRVRSRHEEEHMFIWKHGDLIDVLNQCRFDLVKEHWQTPTVVYLKARKK